MRAITRLVICGCLIGGMHASAFACNALYQPAIGLLRVPCLDIFGDSRVFSATLQNTGGKDFVVTDVREVPLADPLVTGLQVFATVGFHVAAVSGFYGACGDATVLKPTVTQSENNIDVRVKMRVPEVEDVGCQVGSVAFQPFSEAVGFFLIGDARARTYSVNGKPITPKFGCEPLAPPTQPVLVTC